MSLRRRVLQDGSVSFGREIEVMAEDASPTPAIRVSAPEQFLREGACFHFLRVGKSPLWQGIRDIKASYANAVVRHPVIVVETVRRAEIVAAVYAGGKDYVGDSPSEFLRKCRCQHRFGRSIKDHSRLLFRKHHHSGCIAQVVLTVAGSADFAHAVINHQPPVPGQYWRRSATDFETFPTRYRSCQPIMRKLLF